MSADKHWRPGMNIGNLLEIRTYVADGSKMQYEEFVSAVFPGMNPRSDEFYRSLDTPVNPVKLGVGILPAIGLSSCEPSVDAEERGADNDLRNSMLRVVRDRFDRCGLPSAINLPIDDCVLVSECRGRNGQSYVLYSKTYGLVSVSLIVHADFKSFNGHGVAVYIQAARLHRGAGQDEHMKVLKDTAYLHYLLSQQADDKVRKAAEEASKDFMRSIRVLVDAARQTVELDKIGDEAFSRITNEILKPGEPE
jgi:hypothetical protein